MSNIPGTLWLLLSLIGNLLKAVHSWWFATVEVICCISFLSSMGKSNLRLHFQQSFRLCLSTLHLFLFTWQFWGYVFFCFRIQNLPGLCYALCFWSMCNLLRYLFHLEPSYIICCCCLCSYCTWLCRVFEAENCVIT